MLSLFATASALACMNIPMADTPLSPIGKARFKKAFISLYDASLCAGPPPFDLQLNNDKPFALALEYQRKFTSAQLVKATIVEMSRLSGRDKIEFADIKTPLAQCFPDVTKGDTITGVSINADQAKFYLNSTLVCGIKWTGFQEDFFGIWLSDNTRSPRQSRILRGLK